MNLLPGILDKMFFLGAQLVAGERDIEESKKNAVAAVHTLIPVIPSASEAAKIHRGKKR